MTAGLRIIEGLINGGILQSFCAHCKDHDIVTSFNIDAAEQIEALVSDVLNTPCPKTISADTPIGEILANAAPMKAAVWPQPNGCTCYCTEPTVPLYRDANDHLAGCPAKDMEAMKRVMSNDAKRMNELQAQIDRLHTALDGAKTERDEAWDTLAEGLADAERIVEMTKTELTRLRAVIEGAPHSELCSIHSAFWQVRKCDCFKSQLNPQ